MLHRSFGKLFMAQNREEAIDELTQGIYRDSLKFGPEHIELCSSYFYMGRLFQSREEYSQAKSFYLKICEIWKRYVLEPQDENPDENPEHTDLLIEEAFKQLGEILNFLEQLREEGTTHAADCLFALSLVNFKRGDYEEALDQMSRCLMLYQSKLGEYARKTKEVEDTRKHLQEQLA